VGARGGALLLSLALAGAGCATAPSARGVAEEGLRNFGRVDDGVLRCAQPTAQGCEGARRLGVRTVLNLRSEHDDVSVLAGTGLSRVHVPMRQWHVDERKVAAALRVLSDPALRPVLVHCQEGRDRTGLVVAAYRVLYQGWTREEAVAEMRAYGNHPLWANQRRWVLGFDADRMRRLVEEAPPPEVTRP
jgi:protein tyrosine phosphatase (PTP) superfamily phosphohydrolase (DUF442 family)